MTARRGIALVGDSIFDNAAYVPGEPPLIEQLKTGLPAGWHATLLAVDGASARDVPHQLAGLTDETTHIFVSAGGNDALNESPILQARVGSVAEAEAIVGQAQERFRHSYDALLNTLLERRRSVVLCTIYDAIPGLPGASRVALSAFNDVILRAAFRAHTPVIDLRAVCVEDADYSSISPIEPSARGAEKIAQLIARVATTHDFTSGRSVVYP